MNVKMFKAKKDTHRFKKNQNVWIAEEYGNHAYVFFKWRGSGRFVSGVIGKWDHKGDWNSVIGDGFKTVDVEESFANRIDVSMVK